MKKILGLDLGTNSIGWALVEIDHAKGIVRILGLGSRILPMDAGEIGDFERNGKIKSAAAQRTEKRGPRRLNERYLLRRDRLHLVLELLDALPNHYKLEIEFTNEKGEKCGQFKTNKEPKLAYYPKQEGEKAKFLFRESYQEMLNELGIENKKKSRIPYDWTLYFLRQKALSQKISLEEFAWVLLSYNQKRGYEKTESLNEFDDLSEKLQEFGITKTIQEVVDTSRIEIEPLILKVVEVSEGKDKFGIYFNIILENGYSYKEYSTEQITELNEKIDEVKIVERFTILNEDGTDIDDSKTIYRIEDIFELTVKSIIPKDTKNKYLKEYSNGWKVDTNYGDLNKFQRAENEIKEEVFLTRLYNNKGELVKPSKKSEALNLNISNDPFTEFKLLDPNKASNWKLLKKKTEKEALQFNSLNGYVDEKNKVKNYISPKIYNVLKSDALSGNRTKIIGGMFQVVDRDFYREELKQIIATQKQFHSVLEDKTVFEQCVKTLYPQNANHQEALLKNKEAIQHLLVEDILLYQRPLKTKKSEISNCKYEIRYWKNIEDKNGKPIVEVDIETGELKTKKEPVYIKVVSASHPYFQEFRIWDKLHNLQLIQLEKVVDGKVLTNQNITKEFFKSNEDYQKLFEKLNNQKSLNQHQFLTYCKDEFKIDYKAKDSNYAWNFPEDEEIKGNETRVSFATRFKRCGFRKYADFLTPQKEVALWHYLYSVSYKERTENDNKSLTTFFNNYFEGFDIAEEVKEKIINDFANYPKFASKYCAYSEKALKKLLPLIRLGKQEQKDSWINEDWYQKWQESILVREQEILKKLKCIDFDVENVDYSKVVNTGVDFQKGEIPFPKGLFNVFRGFEYSDDFKNLNLTQASYLVYGRHSELAQAKYWTSPDDIRKQLHQELKQHSLNNPVAEKVLLEMMQVVADIWDYYGKGEKDFFSRIHLEVGRELKKSAKEKEAETKRMSGNKAQNKRMRQILEEFLADATYNANPKNSDHLDRLRIVEEGAEHTKNNDRKFFDENVKLKERNITKKDIEDILKKPLITKEDFEKYKLWIEQGYRSPYSGQMIKLTELFDGDKFNIDHIFPQASITNNSLSNKVVVEVALNKLKSDRTAREFIQAQKGQAHLGVPVCSEEDYLSIVKTQFSGTKKLILLSKEIPKGFTSSQLNNTRHIARKAMELLSHIVREPGEVEFRSKNVLPVTGMITTELKRAWKLDNVWTELVAPRYIRLNELTQSDLFGSWQKAKNGQDYFDCNLDESIRAKDESYDIKRIDHRHHALDALIVALCTEDHVNYINNINADAKSDNYGKQKQIEKYRQTLKRKIKFTKKDDGQDETNWYYMLPGEKRKAGAENSLRDSVLEMTYHYKNFDSFGQDYKKMILTALQNTIVTFKQNLRVINKTTNLYNNSSNKNKFVKQNTDNGQKQNWSIRRSLGKDTFYGKQTIGGEEKIVIRKGIDTSFDSNRIKTISDSVGFTKAILLNQLKQFDTIELPFEEAVSYFNSLLEKQEFEAVVNDSENGFKSIDDFINHLKANKYLYKKTDYSKLNVFIDKVSERDFRNEKQLEDKIQEHPEIAFTPEAIEEMNKPENIKKLNGGKNHKPISKVKISRGFGNQRALNEEDKESVKSKQYVVNDAGSNLYLGVYEIKDKKAFEDNNKLKRRIFKGIELIDLIEFQKENGLTPPFEDRLFEDNYEYEFKFSLSPDDLVLIERDNENHYFAFNNYTDSKVYFRPVNHSKEIDKTEIDKRIDTKTNKLIGSQENKTEYFGDIRIKDFCTKPEKIDRLGNISKA